jgi:PPOX class probable F420-dependent enzyme
MPDVPVATVPDTHRDLLERPLPAVLVTLMPDGRPQASVVWVSYHEGQITLNSERARRKTRNVVADPRATLLIVDPDDQHRYLELRCDVVSISAAGALAHRARLDRAYLGENHHTDPDSDGSARVIVTLTPIAVHAYG